MDVWDDHLARVGGELLAGRLRVVEAIAPLVDDAYAKVSDSRGPITMEYRSSVPDLGASGRDPAALAAALAAELVRLRPQEIERGVSLAGPHRDDLLLSIGDLPARGYASQGESWSLALALRLASYELLREGEHGGGEPVLLLDDVFAELDASRRERLAELLAPAEQVLITAAVADDVPAALSGRILSVGSGTVGSDTTRVAIRWTLARQQTQGAKADDRRRAAGQGRRSGARSDGAGPSRCPGPRGADRARGPAGEPPVGQGGLARGPVRRRAGGVRFRPHRAVSRARVADPGGGSQRACAVGFAGR